MQAAGRITYRFSTHLLLAAISCDRMCPSGHSHVKIEKPTASDIQFLKTVKFAKTRDEYLNDRSKEFADISDSPAGKIRD
jgi:hypothetical protein